MKFTTACPLQKTFEFSITSSLKGLSDVIRERFSHSQVLQETQAELEAKVGAALALLAPCLPPKFNKGR